MLSTFSRPCYVCLASVKLFTYSLSLGLSIWLHIVGLGGQGQPEK